jgi:L-serine dehydratase
MNGINTSIFDLFKIGPGPSSSHTIGPMKAAGRFLQAAQNLPQEQIRRCDRIEVSLYGSLSATGRGHGTDRAVLAGLLGWKPETCDSDAFVALFAKSDDSYAPRIRDVSIPFVRENVHFDQVQHSYPYQNTLIFRLYAGQGVMLEKEYYSIGGGFVLCKGESEPPSSPPAYPYSTMSELVSLIAKEKISLGELILRNEEAIQGWGRSRIDKGLDDIIFAMLESVERGLHAEGILPGPIGLPRRANALWRQQHHPEHISDRFLMLVSAYAIAAAEENASHHKVVTAPTLGSAGVIPGVLYLLKHHDRIPQAELREGMLAAAAVGFLIKHNASISGAEVGCQGEIGVASAMAAALLSYLHKHETRRVANAATIALEHHLGLTCDPVGGYVQIPCIERNAVGVVHAYTAYILATADNPQESKVRFDQVVEAMLETGRDMSTKYKETSEGGLAVCVPIC